MSVDDRREPDQDLRPAVADRVGSGLDAFRRLELDLRRSEEARQHAEAELRAAKSRDRSSHRLHDATIQQLFGLGLCLLSLRPSVSAPTADRLDAIIDELEATIRQLRAALMS